MEHNTYVAKKRAKFNGIGGPVNIPYGTEIMAIGGILMIGDKAICASGSQNAIDFFSQNDDGCGLERGKLTSAITTRLEKRDKKHQARWDVVWGNALCQKYRRNDHDDYWLWSKEFFDAPICDLQTILKLIEI